MTAAGPAANTNINGSGAAPTHQPVMLAQVLDALAPRDGAIYVDGTFGAGGYSKGLLEGARCTVWGIDQDEDAIMGGGDLARHYDGRLTLVHGRFGDMDTLLAAQGIKAVDGVALDVGVSSMQLNDAGRGFSFRLDGPLDMRMDRTGPSAAELVNSAETEELALIIRRFGEERHARRIARAITRARDETPITRTGRLAQIVRSAAEHHQDGIDPATRTFQALRIHVNDELGELANGLRAAEALLAPGGRLAVVSFHSLEDRTVKNFLQARSGRAPRGSRHAPAPVARPQPSFDLLSRRALRPGAAETERNSRARSARLRTALRTKAPAWPWDATGDATGGGAR